MFNIIQSKFKFCLSYTDYCVGEKVLKKFYHGDQNYILSDAIIKQLEGLIGKKKIDEIVLQNYIKAFIPNQGIETKHLGADIQERQLNATNLNGNFAMNPHPIIMSQLMKILYSRSRNSQFQQFTPYQSNGIYNLLGSKGISKSTSFLLLRYFHDLRIPYIIKNGLPKQSNFSKNLKILYFICNKKMDQTAYQLYNQIKNDFSPQFLKQLKPNKNFSQLSIKQLDDWIIKIKYVYRKHQIQLKLVVDQCNVFYKNLNHYQINYIYWETIAPSFSKPIILIASMNNQYLFPSLDPIIRIANQDTQALVKIVLDNKITPKQRIQYGIQCLIFQLRKMNFPILSIQLLLNNMKQFPMTTHLSCRLFIQNNYLKMNSALLQLNKNPFALKKYFQPIDINKDDVTFINSNIRELSVKKQNPIKPQKLQIYKSISQTVGQIFWIYKLFKTQVIQYNLKKKLKQYSNNSNKYLQQFPVSKIGLQNIVAAQLTSNEKHLQQQSHFTNYFFKQQNQKGIWIVYCCLLQKQLYSIKQQLYFSINLEILRFFRSLFKQMQFNNFMKALIGNSYKAHICKFINNHQSEQITAQLWHQRFSNRKTFDLKVSKLKLPYFNNIQNQNQQYFKKQTLAKQQILKQQANIILKQGCNLFQTQNSNIAFDFLLTKTDRERLELYFIDASTGQNDQNKKTLKFENQLLKNNHAFQFFLNHLASKQSILNIHIFFIILRPLEIKNKQNYKNILENSKKNQIIFPNKVKIVEMYQLTLGTHFKLFNRQRREFDFKPEVLKAKEQFDFQETQKQNAEVNKKNIQQKEKNQKQQTKQKRRKISRFGKLKK